MEELSAIKPQSSVINRIWRVFATALGFTILGLGGSILLSTLWFTLLKIFIWNKPKRQLLIQKSIKYSFQLYLWIIKILGTCHYQVNNIERLNEDQGCLIVANHPCLLDYVLLASLMPRCDCIVKESLFSNVFVKGVIKSAGYIPNTSADKLLPLCKQKFAQQGLVLIFPEGTRSTLGHPIKLQRGAANIALRCQANIRIVHIECDPPFLTKQQKWYNIPPIKPLLTVTIGEKIAIQDYIEENLTVASRKLTRDLTQKLSKPFSHKITITGKR